MILRSTHRFIRPTRRIPDRIFPAHHDGARVTVEQIQEMKMDGYDTWRQYPFLNEQAFYCRIFYSEISYHRGEKKTGVEIEKT